LRDVVFDLLRRHRKAKAQKRKEKQDNFFKHFSPLNDFVKYSQRNLK
jgi:hypothetical protein